MGNAFSDDRVRLLCLHSFCSAKDVMETQMNFLDPSFSEVLGDIADFTFVNAPFEAAPQTVPQEITKAFGEPGDNRPYYEWWRGHQIGQLEREYEHAGIAESLDALGDIWVSDGPFDGIVGFSQGATIATLIALGVKARDQRFAKFINNRLRVVVAFSGWAIKGSEYSDVYEAHDESHEPVDDSPNINAYFCAGRSDRAWSHTKELCDFFKRASGSEAAMAERGLRVIFESHAGGHIIPRPTSTLKDALGAVRSDVRHGVGMCPKKDANDAEQTQLVATDASEQQLVQNKCPLVAPFLGIFRQSRSGQRT